MEEFGICWKNNSTVVATHLLAMLKVQKTSSFLCISSQKKIFALKSFYQSVSAFHKKPAIKKRTPHRILFFYFSFFQFFIKCWPKKSTLRFFYNACFFRFFSLLSNAGLPETNPLLLDEDLDQTVGEDFQKMLNDWENHIGSLQVRVSSYFTLRYRILNASACLLIFYF